MHHPEFPVVSFLCIALLLISSPSHIKSRSVSTLALIAWMSVLNLARGVNSIVWAGNVDVKLKVWCDITTKLTIGYTFAVPAAGFCIIHHLENVASTRHAQTIAADKRKRQKFEAFMCFGIPVIFMTLHYIVQGHRFDLFEDIGCTPATYISAPALCLVLIPPIMISLASFFYAAKSLRHILRHRSEFARHLNSHTAISSGRYFRLMALAVTVTVWDTGINAYIIYYDISLGLLPYVNWEFVHFNFSRIQQLPLFILPQYVKDQLHFQWWIPPATSLTFFIFFGFGTEAMSNYRTAFRWFRRTVLRQNIRKSSSPGVDVLPSYQLRAPDVNVTFPYVSDNISEKKAWDALVLEMPEGMESLETPSTVVEKETLFSGESSTSTVIPEDPLLQKVLPALPPTSGGAETVPTLMVTKPSNAALRDDFSPATCPRPTIRRSMSHDFGITVSPPYFPRAASASRYHEETFLARDSQDAAPVSDTPLRGIQTITEKTVV